MDASSRIQRNLGRTRRQCVLSDHWRSARRSSPEGRGETVVKKSAHGTPDAISLNFFHLAEGTGDLTRQCSSKKSAATIFPGYRLSGGVRKSMMAQSGNRGTCRALLR